MEFQVIQKLVFESYKHTHKPIWDKATEALQSHNLPPELIDLAEIGLFTTGVSEAMEEIRNADKEKTAKELAGLIIRILNFATRKGISLEEYILSKAERNLSTGQQPYTIGNPYKITYQELDGKVINIISIVKVTEGE